MPVCKERFRQEKILQVLVCKERFQREQKKNNSGPLRASKRTLCTHRALAAAAAHSPGALAKRVWENTHASEPAVPRGGRKGGGGERGSSEGLSLLLPSPTVPPFGSLPGLSVLSRAEGQIFQSNG